MYHHALIGLFINSKIFFFFLTYDCLRHRQDILFARTLRMSPYSVPIIDRFHICISFEFRTRKLVQMHSKSRRASDALPYFRKKKTRLLLRK